jgi:hypothetical protein
MSRDADRAEPALSNVTHAQHLPPHAWDDDTHRLPIHHAFERWSLCHEQGNGRQAELYRRELCRLTADAEERRLASAWIADALREVELTAALREVDVPTLPEEKVSTVKDVPIDIVVAALLVNVIVPRGATVAPAPDVAWLQQCACAPVLDEGGA